MYEERSYQFVDYLIRDTILLKQGAINVPPLQRPVLLNYTIIIIYPLGIYNYMKKLTKVRGICYTFN